MEKTVVLLRAASYDADICDAAVEKIFAALPAAQRIGAKSHVLLKPNLLAKHTPEESVTTHPAILRSVIRACKKRGAGQIIVADSSGGVYNPAQIKSVYKASGLWDVCEQEGVECYTACESGVRSVKNGRVVQKFTLLQPVLDADFIIDLPKFKTHVMTGMTAACKNLFGTIPGLQKAEWHMRFPDKDRFGHMLIDLLETVRPDMAVLDAVMGMEGDGPAGGTARKVGMILGSEDLLNLDLCCAGLMGLDPMRVPYLAAGHERGLCASRFNPADLVGDTDFYHPIAGWRLPSSYVSGSGANTDFAYGGRIPKCFAQLAQEVEKRVAPHPVVNRKLCIGCGKCAEICPQHTIEMKNGKSRIHAKNCIRCFCCHEMCPVKAIDIKQLALFRL